MNPENIVLSEDKLDKKGQMLHDSTDVRLSRPVMFTDTKKKIHIYIYIYIYIYIEW